MYGCQRQIVPTAESAVCAEKASEGLGSRITITDVSSRTVEFQDELEDERRRDENSSSYRWETFDGMLRYYFEEV